MDIVVKAGVLAKELAVVGQAASRKPTIPILSNVLLKASLGELELTATDLEVAMVTRCACTVADAGDATVDAQLLSGMVSSLPSDTDVRLVTEKGKAGSVRLEGGGFQAKLATLPADEFPVMAEAPTPTVMLPREVFRILLLKARQATTDGDKRYFLNGVNLEVGSGQLKVVSSDGHRLVLGETACDGEEKGVIIPTRTIEALAQALEADAETVGYSKGPNHLFFMVGDRLLASRMVDGTFPPYGRIVPAEQDDKATVNRALLVSALRRTAMVMDKTKKSVRFEFRKDHLTLKAASANGESEELLDITYGGADLDITLQGAYVEEYVSGCDCADVVLETTKDDRPLVAREAAEKYKCLCVVMPMRA